MPQIRKKKNNIISENLEVDNNVITSVSFINDKSLSVIEISNSLYVAPNQQRSMEEYEERIERIVSHIRKGFKEYVRENKTMFEDKHIIDINFTSANLRKGYNKAVQVSLFVRKKDGYTEEKLRKDIRLTIKPFVNSMSKKICEEDFKCYKTKQVINKRV